MKKIAYFIIVALLINQMWVFSTFAIGENEPSIHSISPTEIVPGETLLEIEGEGFHTGFSEADSFVCIGNYCIDGEDLHEFILYWTEEEIRLNVPAEVTESGFVRIKALSPSSGDYVWVQNSQIFKIIEGEKIQEPEPDDPYIRTFSPEILWPGNSEVRIEGAGFGDDFVLEESEVCFDGICVSGNELEESVVFWSDLHIHISVPEGLTTREKIRVRAYVPSKQAYDYIESNKRYFLVPEVYGYSPHSFVPGETVLTVSGHSFGNYYVPGGNQFCFGDYGCIDDEYIYEYLISWSNNEIKVIVPEYVSYADYLAFVFELGDTGEYVVVYSDDIYTVSLSGDPKIASVSPTDIVPEETVLTIEGVGFGEEYVPGSSQICFSEECISDDDIDDYLTSWTDGKIELMVPAFVSEDTTVSVRANFPSLGFYEFVESAGLSVTNKPIIEWFDEYMEPGMEYELSGSYFGEEQGKVMIEELECEILTWADGKVTFKVPEEASSGNLYLENIAGIKSKELYVNILTVERFSNDEFLLHQWYLDVLNVPEAWEISEGPAEVTVAVIGDGMDIEHEDISHSIWLNEKEVFGNEIDDDENGYVDDMNGWDFVLNSNFIVPRGDRGTMTASLIAAAKDNEVGIAGLAPNVKIMPLNIATEDGKRISVDASIYAMKYAVDNGADIINLSFPGYSGEEDYYKEILEYAYDNDVLVIVAAGDEGQDLNSSPLMPVCGDGECKGVIGVGSINKESVVSVFSSYGTECIYLAAPGEEIVAAVPMSEGENYAIGDGSAFSAALVSGVAALIKSAHHDWNVQEIKDVLLETASGEDGHKVPDAFAALSAEKPDTKYVCDTRTNLAIEETGLEIEIEFSDLEKVQRSGLAKVGGFAESVERIKSEVVLMQPFIDTVGHEHQIAISFLRGLGIVDGYSDGTFKPDAFINRAEFTKIILNALGAEPKGYHCFPDVTDQWFAPSVCAARDNGIVSGYENGNFEPEDYVTVVEALRILLEGVEAELAAVGSEEAWYTPYVDFALNSTLSFILKDKGYDDPITRGEMAELIFQISMQ